MPLSFLDSWWSHQGPMTLWLLAIWAALFALARQVARIEVPRLKLLGALIVLHFALSVAAAAGYDPIKPQGFSVSLFATQLLGVVISVGLFNALVLGIALGRFQRDVPTVLRDVLVLVSVIIAAVVLFARQGLDVKALLPTGAVLTAVIGLALQQTLGNLIGGLSLQLEKSIRVGDWVSVDSLYGRVSAVKWRTTTLETNDYETVVIPNSQLLAGKLVVRGRRDGRETGWRRWVRFAVPIDAPIGDIQRLAVDILAHDPLPNVASDPAPDCIVTNLGDGSAHFALRYWLSDLAHDDRTDSTVRLRLFYALQRAGHKLALPMHEISLLENSVEARQSAADSHLQQRQNALRRMELFAKLQPQELLHLATDLKELPFAPGDALCRQGDAAESLFILRKGRVSVRVRTEDGEREVAQLSEGSFFGEMGLMTGEPRNATVQALDHVDSYRLDKEAFRLLLLERPEIAETVASTLAARKASLDQAKDSLDQEARKRRENEHRHLLLERIRDYFAKNA